MVPLPYLGVWRRDWIDRYREQGAPKRELQPAIWFQSRHFHVDLRVDPKLTGVAASTRPDVFAQTQIAFAGATEVIARAEREICQWYPRIAFPHLTGEVDAGFMHFKSATHLMEQGLDGRYEESWQRINDEHDAIHCLRFISISEPKRECFLMLCGPYFALGSNYPGNEYPHLPVYAWGERRDSAWIVRESLTPWNAGKSIEFDHILIEAAITPASSTVDWSLPLMADSRWRLLEID
ncbi:MAG TPA: hypothetical protein VNW52_11775 [Burkholderiaceae bacterium]|jgi:hypothetical protein|nr:hypothetical protein [Burkholderiaceae bacterium]